MAFLAFDAIDRQRDPSAALKLLQAAEHEASRNAPLRIVLAQWAVQPYGLLGEHREAQRSLSPDLSETVLVSGGGVRRGRYVLGSAAG